MELGDFIKEQGWSMSGIADIKTVQSRLKKHEGVFDQWIQKGYQADMEWLSRMEEDRYHPDHVLSDVKSVIVLGAWYAPDSRLQISDSSKGLIARYARGKDYHKVLKKRLVQLADFLKTRNPKSEIRTYASVDSGPTVDRVLAEAAGLGFFGKNTCLIDPSKGSFFFIASVLTNLELMPTPKRHLPNCGDCMKCQNACPTGALTAPGKLDARRCISYLTIENKGGIPEELRPKIGNRLFGCDVCQEVCPFNQGRAHHQTVRIEKLKGEYGAGEFLDLREVLSIESDEQFQERFAGTPLMRAKRRGLLRNACVAAGNSGNKELVPYLEKLMEKESDEMLTEHAQWAINQINAA